MSGEGQITDLLYECMIQKQRNNYYSLFKFLITMYIVICDCLSHDDSCLPYVQVINGLCIWTSFLLVCYHAGITYCKFVLLKLIKCLCMYDLYIGIPDRQEHIPLDPTFDNNATDLDVDVNQSTCQVDFATINNQPTASNQPIVTVMMTSTNDTFSATNDTFSAATTNSASLMILLASVAGGILGLCTIVFCILGLFVVKKRKRKQGKIREGIFTTQSLTSIFNGYVIAT